MTAKQYLSEIRWLRENIKISKKIVENFHLSYSSMHGIDYSADKVQSSPKNTLEEAGWKMLEDHEEAVQQLARATSELNHRLDMIRGLSNPIYCEVLYLRFYVNLDINTVALRIQKKPGTAANLQSEALAEFEKKYATELYNESLLVEAARSDTNKIAL